MTQTTQSFIIPYIIVSAGYIRPIIMLSSCRSTYLTFLWATSLSINTSMKAFITSTVPSPFAIFISNRSPFITNSTNITAFYRTIWFFCAIWKNIKNFITRFTSYTNFGLSLAYISTIKRAIFSISKFFATFGIRFKNFLFTNNTYFICQHNFTPINKKTVFGGLSKTVKSLHLLGASILNIKNPFLISI